MKYLFLSLLIVFSFSCAKKYTLDECADEVEKRVGFDKSKATKEEADSFRLGALLFCILGDNNPDKAIEEAKKQSVPIKEIK